MAAAAIIFSAFYGFDAIATAAEETRNPKRDLAIGIVGSMLVFTGSMPAAGAGRPTGRFDPHPADPGAPGMR